MPQREYDSYVLDDRGNAFAAESDESKPFFTNDSNVGHRVVPTTSKSILWRSVLYAILGFSVALTLGNAYFVHTILRQPPTTSLDPYDEYPRSSRLPRPNQFIGLERVNRSLPGFAAPASIINMPSILTQVNSEQPHYVYPQDPRRWFSVVGTVTPDDKNFLANRSTSTIAQFRVLDFGMERCELMFNVSSAEYLSSESNLRVPFDRSFKASSNPAYISIYRLTSDTVLDLRSLSWYTKPVLSEFMGDYSVAEGTVSHSTTFPCTSDSLQTFEFRCGGNGERDGNDCQVQWWQDMHYSLGVFLVQHYSL